MSTTHQYQVSVKYDEARKGTLSSEVLSQEIHIATPPEFPKDMPDIWSPEHYYLAAIGGCLMTTFLAIAENFKLDFVAFENNTTGTLEIVDGKYMMSKVRLQPTITIREEGDRALAEKVIIKAEKACLISNSVKSEISMDVLVEIVD